MKPESGQEASPQKLIGGRKVALLAILVLLLVVSIALQMGKPGAGSKQIIPRGPVVRTGASRPRVLSEDPLVRLDELQETQPEPSGKRNLFTFYAPPAPPPVAREPEKTAEEVPKPVCGDQVCQPGETYENCPTDCQPPPPPEIALRYIGYMQEENGAVVFLTDGKEIYMGRENDIIANRYRILKITNESVELGYLNLKQSKTIPFQGNNQS